MVGEGGDCREEVLVWGRVMDLRVIFSLPQTRSWSSNSSW